MNNYIKNLAVVGSFYALGCSSNPAPRSASNANNGIQEIVHVIYEEERTTITRREVTNERIREERDGNVTGRNAQRATDNSERRLRAIDRQEGDAHASPRNLTLNLEGLISGISTGRLSKMVDHDNTYLDIAFTYRGANIVASLVDFQDEMVGGSGDHVCDYFILGLRRGRNGGNIMRVNFSDIENFDFRQDPHTASIKEHVQVGNVNYRVRIEGSNGPLTNTDIMRMVDTARSRVASQGYQ